MWATTSCWTCPMYLQSYILPMRPRDTSMYHWTETSNKAFPRIRISLHKLSNCNLKLIFWLFMCSSTDLNSFSPRNLTFFLSHNDMSHHLNSLVSKCTVHHLIFQFSPITAVMYILTPNQVAKFLKDKVQFF